MYEDAWQEDEETDLLGVEHDLPAELRGLYPNIALALGGRAGSKKAKTKPLPPASISFRAADGGVRFTITPSKATKVLQGFIQEPGPILAQIEEAIASGNYIKVPAFKR